MVVSTENRCYWFSVERRCRTCGRNSSETPFYNNGRNTCKECWRKKQSARVAARRARGVCVECQAPPDDGGVLCVTCKRVHLDRYYANKEEYSATMRQRRQRLKLEACIAYGGVRCSCCGDSHLEFMTIDHIAGNGAEHRRQLAAARGWKTTGSSMAGSHMYLWLKQNNYPTGFRVLCWNCNASFGHFGYCPHSSGGTLRTGET